MGGIVKKTVSKIYWMEVSAQFFYLIKFSPFFSLSIPENNEKSLLIYRKLPFLVYRAARQVKIYSRKSKAVRKRPSL